MVGVVHHVDELGAGGAVAPPPVPPGVTQAPFWQVWAPQLWVTPPRVPSELQLWTSLPWQAVGCRGLQSAQPESFWTQTWGATHWVTVVQVWFSQLS